MEQNQSPWEDFLDEKLKEKEGATDDGGFSDAFEEFDDFIENISLPKPSAPPLCESTISSETCSTSGNSCDTNSVLLNTFQSNLEWNLLLQKITEFEIETSIVVQKYTNHKSFNEQEIHACTSELDRLIEKINTIEENDLLPLFVNYVDAQVIISNETNFLTFDPQFKQMQVCLNQLTKITINLMNYISLLSHESYMRLLYVTERLLCKGFWIEPPPQIIDATKMFNAKVGFICPSISLKWIKSVSLSLVSEKALQTFLCQNDAHRSIFNEMHTKAKMYLSTKSYEVDRIYKIIKTNDDSREYETKFESSSIQGIYLATCNDLKILGFSRDQISTPVCNDKYSLLAKTTIDINGTYIPIMTYSNPIFITSGGIHDISFINEAIVWDTCFKSYYRLPFHIENSVKWKKLERSLNHIFTVNVGKGLTENNLAFLFQKLMQKTGDSEKRDDFFIWRTEFRDQKLENCISECGNKYQPTFFEWFERAMHLTSYFLSDLWINNCIHGFLSKQSAEMVLMRFGTGTFLIRFSETLLGALSIAFVNQRKVVEHIIVKESELKGMDFGKMILSLFKLKWLVTTTGELVKKSSVVITKSKVRVPVGYKPLEVSVDIKE